MKTIYHETARICKYKYKYNQTHHQGKITGKVSAKFDEKEQIIKLEYRAFIDIYDSDAYRQLGIPLERTEVVYLYHVHELTNDLYHGERPYAKVCFVSDGRLWRWLTEKANSHYNKIIEAARRWWNEHQIREGSFTDNRFLLSMEEPKITLIPQSN